jgi:hypothetical protein
MAAVLGRDFLAAGAFFAFSLVAMFFPPLLCIADGRCARDHCNFCRELFP